MNPVEYLVSKGFRITSNPSNYASGVWGLRNYTEFGINYDAYCNGYHRAFDFGSVNGDGAEIPSTTDGTVVAGTTPWGNFGAQVVILSADGKHNHIYGHLKRNIPVKIGQKVKQGQTIGYQGNTNYNNVYMASHLHYQVQTAGYRPERRFVCEGVNPLNINVSSVKAPAPSQMEVLSYHSAWPWSGKVKLTAAANYRIYPHTSAPQENVIPSGTTLSYDRIYYSSGHWFIRTKYDGGIWFVAIGEKETGVTFIQALNKGRTWATSVGKVDTSGKKLTGDKNSYPISDALTSNTPKTNASANTGTARTFNRNVNRGRSTSAYVMGTIDMNDVHIRNRSGSQSSGFNWNTDTGLRLHQGDTVYIFEVHNGWGRIYTGSLTGDKSNRWIWLERLQVQYIYK